MAKRRVNVITMGCSKNLVDSEVLLSQLEHGKWEVMHDAPGSGFDAVVINTCGFIHDAKQESIDMILDYANAKTQGKIEKLYVMGCLSERYMNELQKEIPEVDRYFGKFDLKALTSELKVAYNPEYIYQRKLTTPSHYAWLKVSEGCNRVCGFCAIPMMTGKHISRPVEDLVREARYLAKSGVKELLVIAQDLSYYGIDLYGESRLADLLARLSEVEGIEWIRLHYLYPSDFPYDILPVMRGNPKICRYLDLPLQHIADPVLKRMLRNVTHEETNKLLRHIKKEVPGMVIRTTMLVGYPGEAEDDYLKLRDFVQQTRFDKMGVFTYSHEEGTYAFRKYKDDVPQEVRQARADELMEIQQQISLEMNEDKIGLKFQVIVDGKEGGQYIGRTRFDSPEVDGEVLFTSPHQHLPGDFVQVKITGAEPFDLIGVAVD